MGMVSWVLWGAIGHWQSSIRTGQSAYIGKNTMSERLWYVIPQKEELKDDATQQ